MQLAYGHLKEKLDWGIVHIRSVCENIIFEKLCWLLIDADRPSQLEDGTKVYKKAS